MTDYSRLSIWENDPNVMSWYDHVVGRTTPSKPFVTPIARVNILADTRPDITQRNHDNELSYQNKWFQMLKAEDRKRANKRRNESRITLLSSAKPVGVEKKKKPDVPKRDPYFEYLFADAGLEDIPRKSSNSIDNLSHDRLSVIEEDEVSDEMLVEHRLHNPSPCYPPHSPISVGARDFASASPSPSREQSPDSFTASPRETSPISPCYPPHSPIAVGEYISYDYASASPSLSREHSPDGSSVSIREPSLVNSPDYGTDYDAMSPDESVNTPDVASPLTSPILISRLSLAECNLGVDSTSITGKACNKNNPIITSARSSYDQYIEETPLLSNENAVTNYLTNYTFPCSPVLVQTPSTTTDDTFAALGTSHAYELHQHQQRPVLKPRSQKARLEKQESKINSYFTPPFPASEASRRARSSSVEIVKVVKKRTAPDSFRDYRVTDEDADVEYICTKKVRTSFDRTSRDVERADIPSIVDTATRSDTASSRTISRDFFNHKPLAIAPKGYAGQFEAMKVNRQIYEGFKYDLSYLGSNESGTQYTFGSCVHPNGTFTHNSIAFDTLLYTKDYTQELLPSGHPLKRCMEHATDMTMLASELAAVSLRNEDEEILRREAHIECANARLEGVSIGYLRYFQGHLSVEEYHEAGMCVCWDLCSCSKMCSRFPDLKCPCTKHITIHSD